jgi:hypothetical protein
MDAQENKDGHLESAIIKCRKARDMGRQESYLTLKLLYHDDVRQARADSSFPLRRDYQSMRPMGCCGGEPVSQSEQNDRNTNWEAQHTIRRISLVNKDFESPILNSPPRTET